MKNRDRQARTLGFASYVELSYLRMNRIGYDAQDVKRFRDQVKTQLVPLAAVLNERRRKRLGLERLYPYDGGVFFTQGNPMPLGDEAFCLEMTRRMYGALSPETKEYIDFLLDNGLYDVTMREGKQTGGYCTQFEAYRAPFIFANFDGTSENAYIMTHEGGHGFYFYLKRNEEIRERGWYTSEMAETHAMAMEFFTAPYMELFFGDRAEDYRTMHLEKAVSLILCQCQQDEFQQIIYEQPQLSRKERNDVWMRLEADYFPFRAYTAEEKAAVGSRWQRIPHAFLWPFYAIDYALAQVCALQYDRWMHEDPHGAWQSYLAFCNASKELKVSHCTIYRWCRELEGASSNEPDDTVTEDIDALIEERLRKEQPPAEPDAQESAEADNDTPEGDDTIAMAIALLVIENTHLREVIRNLRDTISGLTDHKLL